MRSNLVALAVLLVVGSCGDNSIETQLQTMQDIIDDLEQRNTGLEDQLAAAQQERDDLQAKVEALELKLNPSITLEVPLMYGAAPLELGHAYAVGSDTLSFREVRYWLTNVALKRGDGTFVTVPDGYFLVEARPSQPLTNGTEAAIDLPANRRETITLRGIPSGTYTGVRFNVGVDPTHNDDLSNTAGELHTLKNMTADNGWMWFTSYIFTKTRADLAGPGGAAVVAWDNGSNADLREVTLDFPAAVAMAPGTGYTVKVNANLETLATAMSPRQHLVIGAGTPADRALLADAFRDMFAMSSAAANP